MWRYKIHIKIKNKKLEFLFVKMRSNLYICNRSTLLISEITNFYHVIYRNILIIILIYNILFSIIISSDS